MSNFAKSHLAKYGWTEGKGLGKNEDGITKAIKPILKFDTAGFGHKDTNFENWWEITFNNAVKNLTITPENDEAFISNNKTDNNSGAISSKQKNVNPKQEVKYGNFLKAAVLTQNVSEKPETKEIMKNSADALLTSLTDGQLFAICGGRTMHTTARHACTFSGKLERIAQQDNILLSANTSNVSNGQAEKEEIYFKSDDKIDIIKNKYKKDDNSIKIVPKRVFQLETTRFLKCKDSIRKQKRKINNLVHQLSICNIKENNMKSELTDRRSSRKKLKRQKATLIALGKSLKDENKICQIVFPGKTTKYKEVEIKQKQIQEHKDDTYKVHFDDEDWDKSNCNHRKKKSKRNKNRNRQKCSSTIVQTDSEDISISQYKKLKSFYSHSKKMQLFSTSDEGVGKSNKQEKISCTDSVEDAILSGKFLPYGKYSALVYTSETGDLNTKQLKMFNTLKKKIEKKKKKHSKTKKLDKLSQHLSSKNYVRRLNDVDHVVEDLTSLNIATDINSKVLSVEK